MSTQHKYMCFVIGMLTGCLFSSAWGNNVSIPRIYEILESDTINHAPEVEFGNDIQISSSYLPHRASSLASNWWSTNLFCAINQTYNGYSSIGIYRSTDEGRNWSYFGGIYLPDLSWFFNRFISIAVTQNYVSLAYITSAGTLVDTGWVGTYRKPLSGGSGDFFDFPQYPNSHPDLFYNGSGDNLYTAFAYWYSGSRSTIVFYSSTDAGLSWGNEYSFALSHSYRFPKLAGDFGTGIPPSLYLVYNDLYTPYGTYFSKTTNWGTTWSTRTIPSVGGSSADIMCETSSHPYLVVIGTNTCNWINDGGSTWYTYSLPSGMGVNPSCEFDYWRHRWVATCHPGTRVYFKTDGFPPTGFAAPWQAVDDNNTAVHITNPGLCVTENSRLVSWVDSRLGTSQNCVYCDLEAWTNVDEDSNYRGFVAANRSYITKPNPFTTFTTVAGHETERFILYDISGKQVAAYHGDRVGYDLPPGVYFLKPENMNAKSLRIVKVR